MPNNPTRADAIAFVINVIVGWLFISLVMGQAIVANAILLVIVLAIVAWVLTTWMRPTILYAILGVIVGVLLVVIFPQLSAATLSVDQKVLAIALLVFAFRA